MPDTPEMTTCPDLAARRDESPFYSLNYHFGMLLGVDDFSTEQNYHSGRLRLHNAWEHRAGVIWGYGVQLDTAHGEIRVKPGLAADAAGQYLHLDDDVCVNVAEWYRAHKSDAGFVETSPGVFDANVVIRFKECLTRQVPALVEPCDGGSGGTAYSRVFDTVDIRLVPGRAPAQDPAPYHRLRVLFGLDAAKLPDDQAAVDARSAVLALAPDQRATALAAQFRLLAALDGIDLQPAAAPDGDGVLLYPGAGDTPVLLAEITGITLKAGDGGALQLTDGKVDFSRRSTLVATAAIQEMLCGAVIAAAAAGPRVIPSSVALTANNISFKLDKDLNPSSVTKDAFSVTALDGGGWKDVNFTPSFTGGPPTVKLQFASPVAAGTLVRMIARGTGPRPLVGTDGTPLTATGPFDGADFVFQGRS